MRFKYFINEDIYKAEPESYKIELKEPEAIKVMKEHCTQALKNKMKIYRGRMYDNKPYLLIDPSLNKRPKSLETNWINNVIEASPYWKKYPNRMFSLMAATSKGVAGGYGTLYRVLPFDNAKIAICTHSDIWTTFSGNLNILSIDEMLLKCGYRGNGDFKKSMDKVGKSKVFKDYIENGIHDKTTLKLIELIKENGSLYKALIDLLGSPENIDMSLKSIKSALPFGKEVWTNSKCLLIMEKYEDEDED